MKVATPPSDGRTPGCARPASLVAVCLLLVCLVWAIFGQTRNHDFINFDDNVYVSENPHVTGGLTRDSISWAFRTFQACNWHPLVWLSHELDGELYGSRPGGHHLTNVVLHTLTAIGLFLALIQLTSAFWRSAAVAAFWAAHPQRVESVAWIAERKDVLSGLLRVSQLSSEDDVPLLSTRAAALAECGRIPEAVAVAEHGRAMARAKADGNAAEGFERQLAAFAAGRAYREVPSLPTL